MGWLENTVNTIGGAARSALTEVAETAKNVGSSAWGTIAPAWDLLGKLGAQAVPANDLTQQVIQGSSNPWRAMSGLAAESADRHDSMSKQATQLLAVLESSWEGRGAQGAEDRVRPFRDVLTQAAEVFAGNASNIQDAAYAFDHTRNNMVPLPDRPEKGAWDTLTPWDTDIEDQITKYNEAARQNLEVYQAYADQLRISGQQLRADYGQLQPFGEFSAELPAPSGAREATGLAGDQQSVAAANPGQSSPRTTPPPPEEATPETPVGPPENRPGQRENLVDVPKRPGVADVADGTRAAGFEPPGSSSPGRVSVGGLSGPDFRAPGGAPATDLPSGVAGRGSPGGALPGLGMAVPGKGVGAVPGEGTGARPAGAALGSGASAGRGAGMPMAGMPGGAQRSPAGENTEHERRYGLADDGLFRPEGDEDGPVDPRTGQRAVPPTIGT